MTVHKSTLAIFGGSGKTGKYVIEYALKEGYKVRALARTPSKITDLFPSAENESNLTVIKGDFDNMAAIQETLEGAEYVISVAGVPPQWSRPAHPTPNLDLVQKLWPLLEASPTIKVFLFQSGAFSAKPDGSQPFSMKFIKYILAPMVGGYYHARDNEAVQKFAADNPPKSFAYIMARPGAMKEAEPDAERILLKADNKDLHPPGMSMTNYQDVAMFYLKSLKDESLYGTYPYPYVG